MHAIGRKMLPSMIVGLRFPTPLFQTIVHTSICAANGTMPLQEDGQMQRSRLSDLRGRGRRRVPPLRRSPRRPLRKHAGLSGV